MDNKAIDLGLSVLWADKNLGENFSGRHYSWGELYPWMCESYYYGTVA